MTRREVVEYTCDFCGNATKRPEITRWFEVRRTDNHLYHACKKCGHEIHETLDMLAVTHAFVCTEYHSENAMGFIGVEK